MYILDVPSKNEYPELLKVWESSVRASHHFLKEDEIEFLKKLIQEKNVFDHLNIQVARDQTKNILGIMGVVASSLEMLFVEGNSIGKGIGKILMLKFYEYFGFKVISRSELDDYGNPYPILHMELV
jgi:putative acetyltransferase